MLLAAPALVRAPALPPVGAALETHGLPVDAGLWRASVDDAGGLFAEGLGRDGAEGVSGGGDVGAEEAAVDADAAFDTAIGAGEEFDHAALFSGCSVQHWDAHVRKTVYPGHFIATTKVPPPAANADVIARLGMSEATDIARAVCIA